MLGVNSHATIVMRFAGRVWAVKKILFRRFAILNDRVREWNIRNNLPNRTERIQITMRTELEKFKEMFDVAEKLPLVEALTLIENFKAQIPNLSKEEIDVAVEQVPDMIRFLIEKATEYKESEASNAAA